MESGGTLRLLAIALLPSLPGDGRIYLVDEPETGVDPSALPLVRDALASVRDALASVHGSQVLAKTCCDALSDLFEPGSVLRFAKNAGGMVAAVAGGTVK